MLTLLRDALVFAPAPLGRCDVLISGDKIAAVGPNLAEPPAGWPCEVVDCAGQTLAPGLIDGHVHLTGGGGESGPETKVPPLQLTQLTRAGVTSVVGLLGTDSETRTPRELLAAARALNRLGLSAWMWTGAYPVPTPTITGSVRGDVALIEQVIGAGEVAISDHRSSQPTFAEIARLAAECHVGGLLGMKAGVLHLHLGDGPRGLELVRRVIEETELPARVLHPTHCNRNPELWRQTLAHGAAGGVADVSAFPPDPEDTGLSAAEAVRQWVDAGNDPTRLTVSSDGGGCIPVFDDEGNMSRMGVGTSATLLDAIRDLHSDGWGLDRALPFFTSNVADLLRLHGKGRVEVGADADLMLLNAQLEVSDVMARGAWMIRDGEPTKAGPLEA